MSVLEWIDDKLRLLEARQLKRDVRTFVGARGPIAYRDGVELINFGSNDYLNLAGDPRLGRAVADAIEREGWGSGASPLVTGHAETHRLLEERLAEFEGTESALLFTSGYAANAGSIAALVGSRDQIFSDERNHASILDGCRLSRAEVTEYRHADAGHLAELLAACRPARRRLIVTDSLFSMDGDFAPLVEIASLAERYGAMLLVDEAHATGVFGTHGRGLLEHLHVEADSIIRVGTLSKAIGSIGGFVAGSKPLIGWLANRARPYVFSTSMPAAVCAAAIHALEIVRDESRRRETLLANARLVRDKLRCLGWRVGGDSQIIPVAIGDVAATVSLAERLRSQGLLVPGIRPPSVPTGGSRLRISLSSGHTAEMLARLIDAIGPSVSTH
jgi:8-amino-7-oxononanoate synthase